MIVLISYNLNYSRRGSHIRQPQCDRKKAVHPVSNQHTVAPLHHSDMSNRTPLAPLMKSHQPRGNNYLNKDQANVSNSSRGARSREQGMRISSKRRHGQMARNSHRVTKRNRPPNRNTRSTYERNKTPYRQIQRTSSGNPTYTGFPACRAYPSYLSYAGYYGYQTGAHPQIPITSHMANRGYTGKQWY